jgi:tRNA (guanine37-N1)-methyltransferase
MITFHIITIFPESIRPYLHESVLARAQKKGLMAVKLYDPRDFTNDKRGTIDDRPYGGGPGMVMLAGPILKAVKKAVERKKDVKIIVLSPNGKQFTNVYARTLSKKYKHIVLIAGHYEGVDARVKKILKAEEVSIGPYVLTGGELPSAVVVDAVTRQIEGSLGNSLSIEEKRTTSGETYTRPEVLVNKSKKYRVPKVLLSGNHKKIDEWRKERIRDTK